MARRKQHESGTASFAGFAKLIGERSPSYITQLKGEGRLVLSDDGKRVRVQESIALIKATADPSKSGVVERHAAERAAKAAAEPSPTPPPATPADSDDAPSYDGHSTRSARALADKAEWDAKAAQRDYLVSTAQLLPAGDVESGLLSAGTTLRTSLENLPASLAPALAAATDEGRVRVILGEAIEHALEEIARAFATIAKSETDPA